MKPIQLLVILFLSLSLNIQAQDLSEGLIVNDLSLHPMQDIAKPAYLETITDPSFGTTIRRVTDAGSGGVIVPMYSTIQPWNADESLMIVYDQSNGEHQLLDGISYEFIKYLDDFTPADLEQIFWDFDDPDIFYYLDGSNTDFIRYTVSTANKEVIVNLESITSSCNGYMSFGNDVQMMSWDSDVISFRCNNDAAYHYRISTGVLVEFDISDVSWTAPMPAPSGNLFYHHPNIYDATGNLSVVLNEDNVEHSCIGKLANGNDAHFAIAFAQGPDGGCIGDIIAHDMTTGDCFPLISQSQGYDYPQSGTHISAVAHKNTEGGWLAASMMGYDQDGQELLDQELVIAKAEDGNVKVCRIGHHRSDEDDWDYWGEPHACISPRGTRVLFASDWSGVEDGQSIDCYVVELPSYEASMDHNLQAKVLLEGPYQGGGIMSTYLSNNNLLSTTQPFNTTPWNYSGTESTASIPANITDWVLIEVRAANTPNQIVEQKAAFLRNDGALIDINGGIGINFTNLNDDTAYQLIIRTRNHLAVAASNDLIFPQSTPYDFTQATNIMGGDTQVKDMGSSNFALYAGDVNSDGVMTVADFNAYIGDSSAIQSYTHTDINLNGNTTVDDYNLYKVNSSVIGVGLVQY